MKTNSIRHPRLLALAAIVSLALAASVPSAKAVFTFTLSQVGNNVTISGSGSLNTSGRGSAVGGGQTTGLLAAGNAILTAGSGNAGGYFFSGGNMPGTGAGPTSFGTGTTNIPATTSTGTAFGVDGRDQIVTIDGSYVSGTTTSDLSTFANQTFATLGFTPGTYTYTLPSGDTLVVTGTARAVPEPSTWALLGLGVIGLGLTLRARRAVRLG